MNKLYILLLEILDNSIIFPHPPKGKDMYHALLAAIVCVCVCVCQSFGTGIYICNKTKNTQTFTPFHKPRRNVNRVGVEFKRCNTEHTSHDEDNATLTAM